MPNLTRGPVERELKQLIDLFLKAETDIINEIVRLRSKGLVDYHTVAALERVQKILHNLEDHCWTYVPRMIEMQFYVNHPEARKPLDVPEEPAKHLCGYQNAFSLTSEQTDIVQRLVMNLMGQITEASQTAAQSLESMLIGRAEPDLFRRVGLGQTAAMQATGQGVWKALPKFVEALRREGVTAFVDKAGRHWNLHTYGSMVLRTTSRQAEILSILTQDPEQDLYQISRHGSTCRLCASLEGRVYSKSGTDPDFPPLTAAFGKMDKAGPDTLTNSWLNIHPNCLHQLIAWTPMGRSAEEIKKIKDFSSLQKNPLSRDPRTQKQVEAYRQKERNRARWLRDYQQWETYRDALGDKVPKTFETFQRHKYAVQDPETKKFRGDEKYQAWKNAVREVKEVEKSPDTAYNQKRQAARKIILSSDTPKKINIGHQNKHIKNSGHYISGRSYIYGDLGDAQALVDKYHGTGEPVFTRKGEWAKKEVIQQDELIGVDVDQQTGAETHTKRFVIHYGGKGTHIVPTKEKS